MPIPQALEDLPGRSARTTLELVFKAKNIPPLGYRSYYISSVPTNGINLEPENIDGLEEFIIGDDVSLLLNYS